MPIHKETLILQTAPEADVVNLRHAETYIDAELRRRFRADAPSARIHISNTDLAMRARCFLTRTGIELILVRYRAQGWTAVYEVGNQENWLIFS